MNVVKFLLILPTLIFAAQAQEPERVDPIADLSQAELEQQVLAVDNAMFEAAFGGCDAELLKKVFPDDHEFFHDLVGASHDSEAYWIGLFDEYFCTEKPIKRELVAGSHKVYPMHYYGALVYGENRYYMKNKEGEYELDDTGKYMHLWRLNDGQWELTRAISYDHQPPTDKTE
ncbi:nuclear transport factor 2 family protein [Pseudidiomarina homiensis]|uniref:nuclear transport factor 2 family protein n=1 Tax=Pseudidiomarina homiensis TaxID=364198 RepID=UPI00215B4F9B|nr:nuclear transport factor 2 family protein [Pseudidiomarina homiensis]